MLLVAIDGTGPLSVAEYDTEMMGSFCGQIANSLGSQAKYYRGPAAAGVTTVLRAWAGAGDVYLSGESSVMLTGYSRGAAAAIQLAHYCGAIGVSVEALFLFDPVKRDMSLPDADTIPANVRNCYKVLRKPTGDSLLVSALTPGGDKYARGWMRNCGEHVQSPSSTFMDTPCVIDGSHGAAGGVPWGEYTPDKAATQQAASWMTERLRKHGLNITLRSYWQALHKTR